MQLSVTSLCYTAMYACYNNYYVHLASHPGHSQLFNVASGKTLKSWVEPRIEAGCMHTCVLLLC